MPANSGAVVKNRSHQTLFLFLGGLFVHAGNYLIQILLGRSLGPNGFAEFSAVFALWLLLEILTIGVQTTATTLKGQQVASLRRTATRWAWGLATLTALCSPALARLLQMSSGASPILLVSFCLPLSVNIAIRRGRLQAEEKLDRLTANLLLEMTSRLLFTAAVLFLGYGVKACVLALWVSVFLTHSHSSLNEKERADLSLDSLRRVNEGLQTNTLTIMGVQLLTVGELLVAKAVFSDHEAGLFAAVYLLGKVVFLASSPIQLLILSRPQLAREKGQSPLQEFGKLAGLSLSLSLVAATALLWQGNRVFQVLGKGYEGSQAYLLPTVLSALLLVALICCINFALSLQKRGAAALSVLLGLSQGLVLSWPTLDLAGFCWLIVALRLLCLALAVTLVLGSRNGRRNFKALSPLTY